MSENLETKIKELETKVEALAAKVEEQNSLIADLQKQLSMAVNSVIGDAPDLQNVLLKVRTVLERLVSDVYQREFGCAVPFQELYKTINELRFGQKIEGRVSINMHNIRSLASYGVHGGYVIKKDALNLLDLVYDITTWYMKKYNIQQVSDTSTLGDQQNSKTTLPKQELPKKSSLEQFWQEEQESMEAELKQEQEELARKHNFDEIMMRKFVGDPKADEMMQEFTNDVRTLAEKMSYKAKNFIPNVQNKIIEELNKT